MQNAKIEQNRNFFYDFSSELEGVRSAIEVLDEQRHQVTFTFECEAGRYILLAQNFPLLELNGVAVDKICPYYVSPGSFRVGLPVTFKTGQNQAVAILKAEASENFELSAIRPEERSEAVTGYRQDFSAPCFSELPLSPCLDITGYTPANDGSPRPGRFGFLKGDGVLDCAMPKLGVIDKRYVSSHPKYKKPYRWGYSTCPASKVESEVVTVNHLSVTWGAPEFRCTYSLGAPGIITESNSGKLQLRELEFAGNYQYLMSAGGISSLDSPKPVMKENWLVLFGATEFPDLPILIVLDQKPSEIQVVRNQDGRLSEIIFHGNKLMITATPFGMEFFEPISPDDTKMLARIAERAVFWSRALLAYPVSVREYYCNDHQLERTSIIQKFTYRHIADEWGTTPLEIAPLPPAFTLAGSDCAKYEDFKFPSKYGYLLGNRGSMSEYTIPMMPVARKFPLRSVDSKIPALVREGLDDFFAFHDNFPSTTQSYPYAGSVMEPYAFATTMINFMDDKYADKLANLAAERLRIACQPDHTYDYPVISHGAIYHGNPDEAAVIKMYKGGLRQMKLWNWYQRTEPYTGIKYHICYLNLGLFSSGTIKTGTPEEVSALKLPLIENDWGAGIGFYYMYLCALAAGDFSPIEENWELIKSAFSYFDKMCDWACMGTGYSDNAITWVEGANYGAFTSFVNLADAIGAKEDFEQGVYLAAKQFALRSAIFRSAQKYHHRWFEVAPWYINKGFREEQLAGFGFTHIPLEKSLGGLASMNENRVYLSAFYNLTTEGIYPEIFEGLRILLPEDHREVMDIIRDNLEYDPDYTDGGQVWPATQQCASMLTNDALNPAIPEEQVLALIDKAEKANVLMRQWRGIHIFSRLLPKNWFKSQILAWLEMRQHPLWLEHWSHLRIKKTLLEGSRATLEVVLAQGKSGKIIFGRREDIVKAAMNGKQIPFSDLCGEKTEIIVNESGQLIILCRAR